MKWQPIQNAPLFPKNERAGDAQPRLSFKKGGEEEIVDGMASSDLTLKETSALADAKPM